MLSDANTRMRRFTQLLLLAASVWAVAYSRYSLGPLQEALRLDLGLSDNQIAILQGPAAALPMALGAIPLGFLVDRWSRVRLFVLFAVLNLGAALLTAVASSLALLILARCMAGLAFAAIIVAAYSMVGDLYPVAQRGRATMVIALGEIGGAPAAFAAGGFLLAMAAGWTSEYAGWRLALLWMCVPLVPLVALMLLLREPERVGAKQEPPLREVLPQLWQYRRIILPLLLARIMVWIADGAVLVWGAPTFSRRFGLPPDEIGALMGTALLISALLGPILAGPLADICQKFGGPRRTVAVLGLLALLSAPAALFALLPTSGMAVVVLTIFLTLGFVVNVTGITLATIVIPAELRGVYVAVNVTAGAVFCFGVAPMAVSGLSVLLGGPSTIAQALAIVCTVTSILGAVVFTVCSRYFDGAAQAAPRDEMRVGYEREHAPERG